MNNFVVYSLLLSLLGAVVSSLPLVQQAKLELQQQQLHKRSTDGGQGSPSVSPFVMSLFRSFDSDPEEQPHHKYNILRTFENTNQAGCIESQYNFRFNLSAIQKEEDVSKTIFRVYMNVSPSVTAPSALLTLAYLNGTDILSRTLSLTKSNFVEFAVAESVQYWLKHDDIRKQHGFAIRIQFTNEQNLYGCRTDLLSLIQSNTNPVTQPMLAVYSYNHNENNFQEALDRTMNMRQKRSTGTSTYSTAIQALKIGSGSSCQRYTLNLTKSDIEYMTGLTDIIAPTTFNIGTCGGGCDSFQRLGGTHSKILSHLTDNPSSNEPAAASKNKYKKCCVPYSYQSIIYVYYNTTVSPPVVVVQPLHGLLVDKCKCMYTYEE